MKKYKQIDWSLVTIPIIVVFGLSFLLERFPKNSQLILEDIRSFLNNQLSFLYILVGLFFFISTLYAAFSRIGRIKLGDSTDKPEYSKSSLGSHDFYFDHVSRYYLLRLMRMADVFQ